MKYIPFMQAVRHNLVVLAETLEELGYSFERALPDPEVGGPAPDLDTTLKLLEAEGWRMPDSLQAFYEIMDGVEFCGAAPAAWTGCNHPDPISIVPSDPAYWRGELDFWNSVRAEDPEALCRPTLYVLAAGDHVHKAGYSGGAYMFVFDSVEDGLFSGEKISLRFSDYLRLCDAWGGFPGLRESLAHTWPIDRLRGGFVDLPPT